MPFGQPLAVLPEHQRHVRVDGLRQPQQLLQRHLPRGRPQQIVAAHDVGHAIGRVVDHHRQLVGVEAVGAAHDHVAADRPRVAAVQPVAHLDGRLRHAYAQGRAFPLGPQPFPLRAGQLATGAGIGGGWSSLPCGADATAASSRRVQKHSYTSPRCDSRSRAAA